jgi:DNA-binding transcriptional LysR family regulator
MGSTYHGSISLNLQDIAQSTAEIKKYKGAKQLIVTTSSAMATLWLLPKVAQFQKNNNIDLRILTIDHPVDYQNIDSDFCLFYCRTPPANMRVTKLFSEEVFPVCSPEYLAHISPFANEKELFSNNLLNLDDSQHDWLTWSQWFKQVGLRPTTLRSKVSINNYSMLLQAAVNGQGIALGWGALVDDYLNKGTLVKPSKHELNTSATFCLIEPQYSNKRHKDIKAFRDMLLDDVRIDE